MKEIVLASASPRRSKLLEQIGLEFQVLPSDIEEYVDTDLRAEEIAKRLSYDKAMDVAQKLGKDALVIGADTIVVKNKILGKPQSEKEAYEMLKALQGKWHSVITGVTVVDALSLKNIKGYEKTRVKLRKLSDDEIVSYINTGEPMDKAGSYGIQGIGAVLVERIEGCYFNVVGLPLTKLSFILRSFGVNIL